MTKKVSSGVWAIMKRFGRLVSIQTITRRYKHLEETFVLRLNGFFLCKIDAIIGRNMITITETIYNIDEFIDSRRY